MRGDPDPGGRPTGQAPASAHAAGPLLSGARRAGTQPALRLTHREGPARGPAQHWCTAPPARSTPPSASPSCRRQSPPHLGHRPAPPASAESHSAPRRAARQYQSQPRAARPPGESNRRLRRALRSSSLLQGSGLERSWSVWTAQIPDICVQKIRTLEALSLQCTSRERCLGLSPFPSTGAETT